MPAATRFVVTNSCGPCLVSIPSSLLGIQLPKFFNPQRVQPTNPTTVRTAHPVPLPSSHSMVLISHSQTPLGTPAPSPGNTNPSHLYCSACSCLHLDNQPSQVLHHRVDQCQFKFMTMRSWFLSAAQRSYHIFLVFLLFVYSPGISSKPIYH